LSEAELALHHIDAAMATTSLPRDTTAIETSLLSILERNGEDVSAYMKRLCGYLKTRLHIYRMSLELASNQEQPGPVDLNQVRCFHIQHERAASLRELEDDHQQRLRQREIENAGLAVALREDRANFHQIELEQEEQLKVFRLESQANSQRAHDEHLKERTSKRYEADALRGRLDNDTRKGVDTAAQLDEQQTLLVAEQEYVRKGWVESRAQAEFARSEMTRATQERSMREVEERLRDDLRRRGDDLETSLVVARSTLAEEEPRCQHLECEALEQTEALVQTNIEMQSVQTELREMRCSLEAQRKATEAQVELSKHCKIAAVQLEAKIKSESELEEASRKMDEASRNESKASNVSVSVVSSLIAVGSSASTATAAVGGALGKLGGLGGSALGKLGGLGLPGNRHTSMKILNAEESKSTSKMVTVSEDSPQDSP
jgi:hypothetical protein